MDLPLLVSPSETLWVVAGVGLIVHLIFKQTETRHPFWVFVLLFAIPACLTLLYVHNAQGSTILATVKVFTLFWSTLTTSILVYRVSPWHPLAKYPGPLICKLTKFHLAVFSVGGKQYLYYSELHRKYGDVVRIGPNEISIRDVDSITPLMSTNGFEKGPFWSGRIPKSETIGNQDELEHKYEVTPALIGVVDKQEHARRRRPWTRGFSTSALKGYEELVIKRTLQLVEVLLSKNLKDAIDISKWVEFFGYDVMNDIAFGGGSEMMRDGDEIGILHTLARAQKSAIFMSHVPWLGQILLSYPQFIPDYKKFRIYAQTRAMRRIREGTPYKDLFHHLIDEDNLSASKPTLGEVISDSDLAIIAGSDTTSNAITNVLYFLMTNPTAYKRLQAELDGVDNIVDCATQVHLPYLNGVLHEGLRLLPPVLSGVQRAAEKGTGGGMAGSIFIPEGTSAFVHTYSLHRDPRYFSPLPDSFLPERWLSEEQRLALEPKIFGSEQEYINNTAAFIPFSVGPTNCAGKNLAWMEMRMAVSVIVSRFDLKLDPSYKPQQWHDDLRDYFVMIKGSLPALLSPRRSAKA